LPNVLIEAQYRNIPIISSDCPTGPREILMNGKLGELFNVGDYKGLCTKILEYTNNRKKLNKKSYKAKKFLYRFNPILNGEKYNRLISYYLNEKL
jgi:glycosyltransferase involved in cell wall biosynthesis